MYLNFSLIDTHFASSIKNNVKIMYNTVKLYQNKILEVYTERLFEFKPNSPTYIEIVVE